MSLLVAPITALFAFPAFAGKEDLLFRMRRITSFLFLGVAALVCLYPFAWMFFSSFKTNKEIYQPTLFFPSDYEWDSYAGLWSGEYLSFFDYFLHSILVSGGQAVLATFVTAPPGTLFQR